MNKRFLLFYAILIYFGIITSFSQDCTITSKANDILPDKLCAPVSLTWEVTYRGVNDAGSLIQIQVDWDDGNAIEIVNATNSNPGLKEWKVIFSHIYPIGGNKCNYQPEAILIVDGIICTSSIQVQNITVWDTDDSNGGVLNITPQVFPICVGNKGGTGFTDISTWNCTPAGGETDDINGKNRWTQWVYGTGGSNINNATVSGLVKSYPFTGTVVKANEYVDVPQAPNNVSEICAAPITALVNQFFEVTLRNWNYCNPYDDPNIPGLPTDPINGDFPPIETTAIILIVDTPLTSITPAGPFCSNHKQVWLKGSPGGGVWIGNGVNSSGRFRPWVAGPGIHTITYTTTDPTYGCDGTATIHIEVFAIPKPQLGPDKEVCPGDIILLDANPTIGDGAITSHLWSGDTSPLSATNIQNPSFTTTTQGLYNLDYTINDDNGCSNTESISVNVNPANANIIPDPANVCAGDDLILNGNPSGGTGTYVTHVWGGDISNLNTTNTQSVIFNSTVIGTYNFTYNVTDDNSCSGNDATVVTVFQNPIANAGTDDNICDLTIQLSASPSIGTSSWSQISGPGTLTFDDNSSATAQVTADQYGLYQIEWKETHGPSCESTDIVEIRFTEQPIANAGNDGGICGYTYQLSAIPSVGNGYWSISSGAGNLTFVDNTQANTYITSDVYGNYNLIWHEDNGYGCTDEDHVLVSFNLVPIPAFNPIDPNGCSPFTVDFKNQSTGGTTYNWDFGNGDTETIENPSEIFVNNGSNDIVYTVRLIVNNPGCGDTVKQTVTVHPLPKAQFSHNGAPVCSPSKVDFINTSLGSVSHTWSWGDGTALNTENNITHIFENNGVLIATYPVELIAKTTFGCVDTATQYITVYPTTEYLITASPDTACQPAEIQFSTLPSGLSYEWDFGNGLSETGTFMSQSNYINNTGTELIYNIGLTVTSFFGCVSSTDTFIVIHPSPIIDFNILNTSGCAPFEASLENISIGAIDYFWDFGDGTSENNTNNSVLHEFDNVTPNPVIYNVKLTGTNAFGCSNYKEKPITIYPQIKVAFKADTVGCHPLINQMINLSNGASSYNWAFGDGSTSTLHNPNHIYNNNSAITPNSYSTILTGRSIYGCTDSDTLKIRVLPKPVANFSLPTESGCSPYLQNIQNTSIGGETYKWQFGDGESSNSSEASITHLYTNKETTTKVFEINLELINSFACRDRHISSLSVYPGVTAAFVSDTAGCSPLAINFINESTGGYTYAWDLGNGTTSSELHPSKTYVNYTDKHDSSLIRLIVRSEYNCSDTTTQQIVVYATPQAAFTVNPKQLEYPYTTFIISNHTSSGNWDYLWEFGDGNSSDEQFINGHTYDTWGEYDIWLKVYNNFCTDSVKNKVVIITPQPTADFEFTPASGCNPLRVEFTNTSTAADEYFWNFGDGKTSHEFEPIHIYQDPGNFYVRLSVINEIESDEIVLGPIRVHETPTAHLDVSPEIVFIPEEPIKCFNLSIGEDSVLWLFGDGGSSNEDNPIHFYQKEGFYNITIIAMTEHSCMDTAIFPQTVEAKSEGKIDFPNAFRPSPSGSNGGSYPYPDTENIVFHPVFRGVTDYELSIYNRWGELIFLSRDVDIGWDGYFHNKICKQDVYVWKVQGKYIDGKQFIFAGDLTLLR